MRPVAFLSALLLLPALPTEAGRVPTVPSDSCVAPELRAAAFRVISAEDATPFLQAMHRCVVVRPMAPKAALRRT